MAYSKPPYTTIGRKASFRLQPDQYVPGALDVRHDLTSQVISNAALLTVPSIALSEAEKIPLVLISDSNGQGNPLSNPFKYLLDELQAHAPQTFDIAGSHNFAVAGSRTSTMRDKMLDVAGVYKATAKYFFVLLMGATNDLIYAFADNKYLGPNNYGPGTQQDTLDNLQAITTYVKGLGSNVRVILINPSEFGHQEALAPGQFYNSDTTQPLRQALTQNWPAMGAARYIDTQLFPPIAMRYPDRLGYWKYSGGAPSAFNDWQPNHDDGIHISDAGRQYMGKRSWYPTVLELANS